MSFTDTPDWADSALTAGSNFELANVTVTVPATSGKSSAAIPVASFETVIIQLTNSVAEAGSYQVQWYADAAATQLVYSEKTYFTADINGFFNAFAVKAGYLVVFLFNDGATAQPWGLVVNGVRGGAALGEVFPPQVMSELNAVSIPANTQNAYPVQSAIPGPASMWIFAQAAGNTAVQHWNGTVWVPCLLVVTAAGVAFMESLIVPGDEIRVTVDNNTGAAANFNYSLVHGS